MAAYSGHCPRLSWASLLTVHSRQEEGTTIIPFHRSKQTREDSNWPQVTQPAGDGAKSLGLCVGPSHPLYPRGWSSSPDSTTVTSPEFLKLLKGQPTSGRVGPWARW